MAFEVMKAKREARRARREAIEALDVEIGTLTVGLLSTKDRDARKEAEEEIAVLAATREVLKKKQELPKWLNTAVETGIKVGGVFAMVATKQYLINVGADRTIGEGVGQIMKS